MGAQINLQDTQGRGEVVLLAKNEIGYVNLSRLLSKTLLEAEAAHDPACLIDDLTAHSDGLLLLTGGAIAGFVGGPAGDGRPGLAMSRARHLSAVMGDRIYVELQRHGLVAERTAELCLLDIADQLDLPLVATNDCRFENAEMSQPHDTLVCIGTGCKFSEADRPRFSPEHHFKSAATMTELFKDSRGDCKYNCHCQAM